MTHDIDIERIVDEENKTEVFRKILTTFRPRVADAFEFAQRNRVLLVYATNGVPVDLVVAPPSYSTVIGQRTRRIALTPETPAVSVISPEDLIILKMIAHRPVDL